MKIRKYFICFVIIVMALSAFDSLLTGKGLAGFLLECVTRLFTSFVLIMATGAVIALFMFVVGSIILITGIHKDVNADPGTITRTMKDEYS
jgi:hypothetical protein